MAYFPHAFEKLFVGTAGFTYGANKKSLDLTAGQIGVINSATNAQVQVAAAGVPAKLADLPSIYLAQGSFHANDKIGPFHGGYKESIKSKVINPRQVSRFFVTEPKDARSQKVVIGGQKPQLMVCNQNYYLRVDVKGEPILRALRHNLYIYSLGQTGCCPVNPADSKLVDPAIVFEMWATEINSDEMFKPFVKAKVIYGKYDTGTKTGTDSAPDAKPADWAATDVAIKYCRLELSVIYSDTVFGQGSWQPDDHYQLDQIRIYASVQDELKNPCLTPDFPFTETQSLQITQGGGESLVRDLILFKRYLQEPFQQDLRMREVLDDTSVSEISRSSKYFVYNILHSVVRKSNPTSQSDNDQYMVRIVVNARDANFEAFMQKYCELANNGIALEVF